MGHFLFVLLLLPSIEAGHQFAPDTMTMISESASPIARSIGAAVERTARHTPWNGTCLTQTIAGRFMLRRCGVSSRRYLGTRKDETRRFDVHSWPLAGNEILMRGAIHESFTD